MAGIASLAVPAAHALSNDQGAFKVPLVQNNILRDYRLWFSPDALTAGDIPLVVMLHSLGHTSADAEIETQFDQVATANHFAVVYPDGLSGSWNAGLCCGKDHTNDTDDVDFLTSVLSSVRLLLPIDPSRIYIAGSSNGGMMALTMACTHPELFAAAASVEGTIETSCALSRPATVLAITGGRDQTVPYAGRSLSPQLKVPLPSAPRTIGTFERQDACSGLPSHTESPVLTTRVFTDCWAQSTVQLDVAKLDTHTWPTTENSGFDASNAVWDFFKDKRLPTSPDPRPTAHLQTNIVATSSSASAVSGYVDGRYDVVTDAAITLFTYDSSGAQRATRGVTTFDGHFAFAIPRDTTRALLSFGQDGSGASSVLEITP